MQLLNATATLGLGLALCSSTMAFAAEPITPIEAPTDVDAAKAEIGKQLFFDPRLSKSGFLSCNSCHNLSMGGADNLPSSVGHAWHQGPINSPTVLNSAYNLAQFWDGRAADLQEQAAGPIANPGEMAQPHNVALEVIASIPGYVESFSNSYGDDRIDLERVTEVIAEFERTLVTPNSRFDQWLTGNKQAITEEELEGYQLFKGNGCAGCHNGPAVGATLYQKMGLVKAYETDNPALGRYAVTGRDSDRMVFKVPTLRNIELTYPYFHDGKVSTLEEAVQIMGEIQLGRRFSESDTAKIVAFLKTLTGEQPDFALPQLPPSTPATPHPQPFGP
ncbi:cytochrome-c peroxidase [Congregibacter sp.]|uniref:cytochrome-c peroxidase n=1 Tax=Congregibacter sp. TaxID=2744308 RepID=UPI003F6D9D6B